MSISLNISFDTLVELVDQLSPQEKSLLVERLGVTSTEKHRHGLDLLVFDVGEWPQELTLRREDEYDDDRR